MSQEFVPSEWSRLMTVTSQRADNTPTPSHRANLELLGRTLSKIPFKFRVNSAYRSPSVNALVGGAKSSHHMTGLAADITPLDPGFNNKMLAAWLYLNRASFPELDQVIWYSGTSHVHIGVCPRGASGCSKGAPRAQFFWAPSEGSNYISWFPSPEDVAGAVSDLMSRKPLRVAASLYLGLVSAALGLSVVGLAILYRYRDQLR